MKVGLFFVCGQNFVILPQKSVPSVLIARTNISDCTKTILWKTQLCAKSSALVSLLGLPVSFGFNVKSVKNNLKRFILLMMQSIWGFDFSGD